MRNKTNLRGLKKCGQWGIMVVYFLMKEDKSMETNDNGPYRTGEFEEKKRSIFVIIGDVIELILLIILTYFSFKYNINNILIAVFWIFLIIEYISELKKWKRIETVINYIEAILFMFIVYNIYMGYKEEQYIEVVKEEEFMDVEYEDLFESFSSDITWECVEIDEFTAVVPTDLSKGGSFEAEVVVTGDFIYMDKPSEYKILFYVSEERKEAVPVLLRYENITEKDINKIDEFIYSVYRHYSEEDIFIEEDVDTTEIITTENLDTTEIVTMEDVQKEENIYEEQYVGTWWDLYSQRAWMTIDYDEEIGYLIEINWSSSASENSMWVLSGKYSKDKNGIVYQGELIRTVYNDDGSVRESIEYEDGEGLIYFKDDGLLYWDDWENNQGQSCMFEKEIEQGNYDWYKENMEFRSVDGTAYIILYVQNDVVIWGDVYLSGQYLTSFELNIEPDEIGEDGEYIYYDSSITLIYYPEANTIKIEASAGMIDGRYVPVTE